MIYLQEESGTMRITQWGEYGIHFSVMVALEEAKGHVPVGAERIAQYQGIDLHYAQQILQRLRKKGVVKSIRGPQGGYRLAKPSSEITIKDILIACEGSTLELICDNKTISHARCQNRDKCSLNTLWQGLKSCIDSFLSVYTLEEFAKGFSEEHEEFTKKHPFIKK